MLKCPRCGNSYFNSATTCKKCGLPLNEDITITGTLKDGIEALNQGDLNLGTYRCLVAVKRDGNPSDADYKELVKAMYRCITKHVSDTDYPNHRDVSALG